jgi:ferredoxin
MKLITRQKPFDEISEFLGNANKIYLAGCGSCAMMCHTGGEKEVLQMKDELEEAGKKVTGWTVIPMACDELTPEALNESIDAIKESDAILVMSCAFGVQTVGDWADKAAFPALNTLFIGKEQPPNRFVELCIQCGECVIANTGGICPLTSCPKGLLNGPCGGTNDGSCEVSKDIKCCWVRIYERMKKLDMLEKLDETIMEAKDWSHNLKPGTMTITEDNDK